MNLDNMAMTMVLPFDSVGTCKHLLRPPFETTNNISHIPVGTAQPLAILTGIFALRGVLPPCLAISCITLDHTLLPLEIDLGRYLWTTFKLSCLGM